MTSIRKTKKRLKREIQEEQYQLAHTDNCFLADTLFFSIKLKYRQLENLKRKQK